jgi:hypothetical protein
MSLQKIEPRDCSVTLMDDGYLVQYRNADLQTTVRHATINANLKPTQDVFDLAAEIGASRLQRRRDLVNAGGPDA